MDICGNRIIERVIKDYDNLIKYNVMKRRSTYKESYDNSVCSGALAPFKSVFAAPGPDSTLLQNGAGQSVGTGGLPTGPNIFQSIGVEPIINCRGTFTIIGGSVEPR